MAGVPIMAVVSDEILIQRIAGAPTRVLREGALRQLAARHLNRAHAIAMRVLHHRPDAEEAVQDALTRVWRNAAAFDPARASFTTWLYRIVANAALDRLRRRPPAADDVADHQDGLADESESSEARLQRRDEARRVRAAVAALPPQQRLAVALCYFDDFTQPEAARIMNIHLKALEGLLFRAKTSLKRSLTP